MDLRISETGVRSGELITSSPSGKQNKGAVIEIRGKYPPEIAGTAIYPPEIARVKQIDPIVLRDNFNVIPFFANMTPQQRSEWLINNGTNVSDLYMEDAPNLFVKFIKIGTKNFFTQTLSQDVIDLLLKGNPNDPEGFWSIMDVYNLFPRKPGSKARKTTLVFRPSNWSLMIPERLVNQYTGIYINLTNNTLANGTINAPTGGKIYSFKLESKINTYLPQLGVVITENRHNPISEAILFQLASKYIVMDPTIKGLINWFPPSLHKSLIQKLIRTRCDQVEYNNVLYPASAVLLTSISLLLLHPGVFVPDIRRFVTGIESAAKRLAVSIHEDGYTEKHDIMMGLYTAAMIAQDDRNWIPTDAIIDSWFRLAVEAQQDKRMFAYDFHNFNGNITQYDPISMSYFLLNEVRSFQTDIDMVGSISQNKGSPRNTIDGKMAVMPLIHCLDHHSITEIAHYMPYTPNQSYGDLFRNIWQQVVGVNPRKPEFQNYYLTMEQQPFVQTVRMAQRDTWISKMFNPTDRNTIPNLFSDFTYKLDPSWLAGLIGPIEIKLAHSTALVVLRVDNIYEMTAVKRPQRDTNANPELTEEEQIQAITNAKAILAVGKPLNDVPSTLPLFIGASVYLRDEQYIIVLKDGGTYLWETLINMSYKFPIHPSILPPGIVETPNGGISNALIYTGNGIDQSSGNTINHIIKTYNPDTLRRLSTYLTGYKSSIELAKISRDGTGTYYQVVPEDTAVNQILCYLCVMYPAAIVKTSSGFQVKTGPLLWTLRDMINSQLGQTIVFERKWVIPTIEKRQRWEHQVDSVRQMIERNKAGKKGHLIWIKVGLGKSLISIDYLDYLIREGKMPPYCVYSLPASAINNIVKEFEMRGIPIKLIDARQSAKTNEDKIEPYKVCIIKHDHMRLGDMEQQLNKIAREMVFIVDEFHKTLSKTIRTSIALELSRLSYDFIGMSGTIIKDTNYDELIRWLEMIVSFEVTEKNYWVAIGALVSRKVNTKVVVDRQVAEVAIPPDLTEKYKLLVPDKLGGTARQINFKKTVNLCYDVVTQQIVNTTIEYVKLNEGVFVVAKDIKHQEAIKNLLIARGLTPTSIHLFGKDTQITLTPEYNGPIKVVITTIRHSEGYTLTKFRIMITSVYFSNQATREQLEGRINRIGQISPMVRVIIYHAGILSYIHEKYEKARTLAAALKGFAVDVGIEVGDITNI